METKTYTTTHTYTSQSTGELRSFEVLHIILPVTIKGITKEIEFSSLVSENGFKGFNSGNVVACQIGRGEKRHKTSITAWVYESETLAKAKGYTPEKIHNIDGIVLAVNTTSAMVRNRQARVTDWADDIAGTSKATAQKYYGGF